MALRTLLAHLWRSSFCSRDEEAQDDESHNGSDQPGMSSDDKKDDDNSDSDSDDEDDAKPPPTKGQIAAKAIFLLVAGTAGCAILSDPLVDAVSNFSTVRAALAWIYLESECKFDGMSSRRLGHHARSVVKLSCAMSAMQAIMLEI